MRNDEKEREKTSILIVLLLLFFLWRFLIFLHHHLSHTAQYYFFSSCCLRSARWSRLNNLQFTQSGRATKFKITRHSLHFWCVTVAILENNVIFLNVQWRKKQMWRWGNQNLKFIEEVVGHWDIEGPAGVNYKTLDTTLMQLMLASIAAKFFLSFCIFKILSGNAVAPN